MTKNVKVLSSEGNLIGVTYPKRAMGLVKKGRARYLDGDETVIVLAAPPDDITSQEDEMNNFNFDEFIEKTKAAAKAAGETVYPVIETTADKATDALNRAIERLNAVTSEHLAKRAEEDAEEAAEIEAEMSEIESDLGEIESELENLDESVESEHGIRLREKLAALASKMREKTHDYEALRRGKELCKNAGDTLSDAVHDAAKWAAEVAKEAKHSAEAAASESKRRRIEAEIDKASLDSQIDKMHDRINELRESMKAETDHYLEVIHSMEVSGTGDIATQAKATAISEVADRSMTQSREILQIYTAMLKKLYSEREEYNAQKLTREAGESNAKEAQRAMFTSTVEAIVKSDENIDVNVLAFYIKTAEKLAKEGDVMTPDIASVLMKEMLTETDANKLSCYMNLIDSMK